ncbi:MAG: hypothetical protein AAF686_08245, partial [Pseudomonadota bacterium]
MAQQSGQVFKGFAAGLALVAILLIGLAFFSDTDPVNEPRADLDASQQAEPSDQISSAPDTETEPEAEAETTTEDVTEAESGPANASASEDTARADTVMDDDAVAAEEDAPDTEGASDAGTASSDDIATADTGAVDEMAAPEKRAPEIDTFRLEPDGQMLVAGRSMPGWQTTIRLDQRSIAEFTPEGNGDFVQFVTVEPSTQPRILSLSARSPDTGEDLASDAEIIIAPLAAAAPSVIAEAPETTDGEGAAQPETEPASDAEIAALAPEPDIGASKADDVTMSDDDASQASDPSGEVTTSEAAGDDSTTAEAVTEPDQTAVLLSDEEGIRLLQAPRGEANPPEVMTSVALDTISYSESGEVELTGRASGEGFVRVYVDNAPVITAPVEKD